MEGAPRDASQSRGFGLGLAIVKRSADLLGSPLFCRSRPGHGSVFAIELPAAALPPGHAAAARDAGPHRSCVVLVVDDDEQILSAMGLLLRGWGHKVLVARTLQEALACVASAAALPQVALIDMHLSADENGVQVIAALRARLGTDLRAAVITGDTSPEVMAQIRAASILTLHKPVAPDALRQFIEAAPAVP